MAVQFGGLVQEHQAVRQHVGVFDISHMGVLTLQGDGVKDALQALLPTDLFRIGPGEACYSVLLNEAGGIRDDLIVYDRGRRPWLQAPGDTSSNATDELVLVINAACAEADTAWIRSQLEPQGFRISDRKGDGVLLALQGPEAAGRLEALCGESLAGLPRFGHRDLYIDGQTVFTGRTGYTGEDGFELLLSRQAGLALWQRLLAAGVTPCGLGARDTLRTEVCYPLYGHELDEQTSPVEAGLGFFIAWDKGDFVGRSALLKQKEEGPSKKCVAFRMTEKSAPPRPGYQVAVADTVVGTVASGTQSPTLNAGIGLAYVPPSLATPGTALQIEIRGKRFAAEVVKKPFYRKA
jgi:aminomethyltransferase